MDIRIEKTKKSIINAFIELRSRRPLEKVTVKELCEKAMINKSTFYSHYSDVYDLSAQLENEVIESVLGNLGHPEYSATDLSAFTVELFQAFLSCDRMINILFSGSRSSRFLAVLKPRLLQTVRQFYPEYSDDPEADIILNYCINGSYYAFMECREYGDAFVVQVLGRISDAISRLLIQT